MDTQQRGRLSSQGSRHTSPQPSPHRFNNGYGNPNTSANPHSFADPFSGAQIQNSMLTAQDPSMYSHNQYNQSAFQGNQYPDQGINQDYNPNDFLNTGDNEFGQDFSYINQSYNPNQHPNVNPADLSKMSSSEQASPGSGLLSPEHSSPGPQAASPVSTNGQFHTPQHSRHASLDPSSAYGVDPNWQGMQFQQPQHRRLPSDQYSNASSHSPYLGHAELADTSDANRSPYLAAQDTNTYGIESFNINEPVSSQPGSTYVSPRLMPQQGLGLEAGIPQVQDTSLDMFSNQPQYSAMTAMHMRNQSLASEMGQADQFAMPTINIEPAPVSRQASFGPQGERMADALSPPSSSRGRNRSQSDTTGITRPINSRSVSPSAGRREDPDSLSVRSHSASGSVSRESSPGVSSGRVSKDRDRRASTSSIHSRDYILDLADPGRPNASPNSGSSRVQKHPATFQCTLCPKKFTRAYNLRSHLRTHTDERPFVCTVCGKAFARQHDRKRHEGLHSGEKKFICKGELNSQPGQTWGCGRRFARADALGRHFRSEAGRVCIKPLLDEEAAERRNKQLMEQQQAQVAHAHQQQYMQGGLQPVAPGMMIGMDPTTQTGGFALPAALMAQYPQLANLDWNAISQQNLDMDDGGDLSDVGYDQPGGMDDGSLAAGGW